MSYTRSESHGFPVLPYATTQYAPEHISHAMQGLICPNDRPPMFGPFVTGVQCLPIGTCALPYHRRNPTAGLRTNCTNNCNTQPGCLCNLMHMKYPQKPAALPVLNPEWPLTASIFVD